MIFDLEPYSGYDSPYLASVNGGGTSSCFDFQTALIIIIVLLTFKDDTIKKTMDGLRS